MYIYPIFLTVQIKLKVPLHDFIFILPSVKNEMKMTFKMNKKRRRKNDYKMYYVGNQFYIVRRIKSSSFIHFRSGLHLFTHVRSAFKKVYNIHKEQADT